MKLQLEMLKGDHEIENLKADVSDMEHMVEGYLDFARGQDAEQSVKADLSVLVGDVVAAARRDGGAIEMQPSDQPNGAGRTGTNPFTAFVRPISLKRCLTNLLNNARRHADHISVSLKRNGDYLEIAIEDDGPGIPEEQRGEVFLPFRRLDESRNLDTGGTGLGLTVARDVARSHGGDIILSQAPAGGLRALVRLPA
jgi:two-component system osmolarity sensor histidine kinase EnvZ